MRKKTGAALGVGGASILVIFVLLCLTTFAALSLVSANADLKLTQKTAEASTAYYAADAEAEEILSRIDACLLLADDGAREAALLALEGVSVEREGGALRIHYTVPITDERTLSVSLAASAPGAGTRYTLTEWRDTSTAAWEEDDTITLWDGGFAQLPD